MYIRGFYEKKRLLLVNKKNDYWGEIKYIKRNLRLVGGV